MPAYVQHHDLECAPVICPSCVGLRPMFVRFVEPHWSMATIDFVYECSDCGAEVRETLKRESDALKGSIGFACADSFPKSAAVQGRLVRR
jgi:DNA-directed RNA polymerase subunit RPC12/RpoP